MSHSAIFVDLPHPSGGWGEGGGGGGGGGEGSAAPLSSGSGIFLDNVIEWYTGFLSVFMLFLSTNSELCIQFCLQYLS